MCLAPLLGSDCHCDHDDCDHDDCDEGDGEGDDEGHDEGVMMIIISIKVSGSWNYEDIEYSDDHDGDRDDDEVALVQSNIQLKIKSEIFIQ